jgi:MoxR-like ATPase
MSENPIPGWMIYKGVSKPTDDEVSFPAPPPWRDFALSGSRRGETYQATPEQIRIVNAALYLRRPLLVTGRPGVGKSSLAYSVAEELRLGAVLRWTITSRTTLNDGLYRYDAIGRLQEAQLNKDAKVPPDIGKYLTLGPLGTAMLPSRAPRVLLIDEIDKSDIDLPNDLLNIFEEGEFEIPELARIPEEQQPVEAREFQSDNKAKIDKGKVRCTTFPFVVMTSNGERDFPAPFLRRCLRLYIKPPDEKELARIVNAHLEDALKGQDDTARTRVANLINEFVKRRDERNESLANDQLLNAIFLMTRELLPRTDDIGGLKEAVLKPLDSPDEQKTDGK